MPDFYLGISRLNWLKCEVIGRAFISMNSFDKAVKLPESAVTFAVDSGGFKELQMFGRWRKGVDDYAQRVQRIKKRYGAQCEWVSPQDWMCEPIIVAGGRTKDGVFVGTGESVETHQVRTVENYIALRARLGDLVVPVVQGWTLDDYHRCLNMYLDRGVDLTQNPRVGIGSVCRRQGTREATDIVVSVAREIGPRLHGYGFKKSTPLADSVMVSKDSFAWAYAGMRRPNETHTHYRNSSVFYPENAGLSGCAKNCAQCLDYALDWRDELVGKK